MKNKNFINRLTFHIFSYSKTMDTQQVQAATELGKERKKRFKSQTKRGKRKYGVIYPVARIRGEFREKLRCKLGVNAVVYFCGVAEYIMSELAELSYNVTLDRKKAQITPRDCMLAVRGDEELDSFCHSVIFKSSGVLPHVHRDLLKEETHKKSTTSEPKPPVTVAN